MGRKDDRATASGMFQPRGFLLVHLADQALPVALRALQVRVHQRLGEVAVAAHQRVEDLQMLGMRFAAALGVVEIDRQPPLAHHVVERADAVEHAVLGGAHDLEMEVLVLDLCMRFARGDLDLGGGKDLAQRLEILLRGAAAGEFGGLDLVDLAQLDRFVDLDGIERQAGAGEQGHRLDAGLALGQVDARLGAAFDEPHRLEDRERLADLAAR